MSRSPHPATAAALARLIGRNAAQGMAAQEMAAPWPVLPLGAAIDAWLPGGGLAQGALHEVAGCAAETEHAAAAALFVAGALARVPAASSASRNAPWNTPGNTTANAPANTTGMVIWALGRPALFAPPFAPGLAGVGLHPDRVIYAEAGPPEQVLMVMEEGLRQPGLAGVVGELEGRLSLTATRRLHLAAQASGVTGFVIRRSLRHDDPALAAPTAAVTRWRISPLPSAPPLPHAPQIGLGPALWRLELRRCRGGVPHQWITEACDAQGRLGFPRSVAAALADRPDPPARLHHTG